MTPDEQPDELDRILELIVLRMSGTKSFWSSDGSPQQTSVTEIIGKDKAKAALQAYISQHYVPIGQTSDGELDSIICSLPDGFVYGDDDYTRARSEIDAWVAQHTKEAVEAAKLEEADYYVQAMSERFDALCSNVHQDPNLGNSPKSKKDNFLDGAELMLTEIQYQAERTRASLALPPATTKREEKK